MIKPSIFLTLILVVVLFTSCKKESEKRLIHFPPTDLTQEPLIPIPLSTTAFRGGFALDDFTVIKTNQEIETTQKVAEFLADKIHSKTGLTLPVNENDDSSITSIIYVNESETDYLNGPEAYELIIKSDSLILNTNSSEGAFRGIQTIRQLIPTISNDTLAENPIWVIPTGKIIDRPRFEYRGNMLDVARHFFDVEDLKKYIDVLSYYKLNHLHLHLSDDQGWRIEIKSWPKLTEIGGSTEVGGESGGFYTQEEFLEIIEYAASRFITIIPEIDMPGHTNAASASYPFLNGNGKTPELYEGMKVGFSTLNTRKDTVYTFIDDVVREISALIPGPYFHIGGDESHVTKKEDYIYFVDRVEKIVQKHGKQMIGWDEISNTNIDNTSIVQFWASMENAKTAASKNMKIVLSPAQKAYLDMKYDSAAIFGLNWAGYIPTDTAYIWDPKSYLPEEHILGIEAPLWSETISTISELEYLAFPRVIGYAELGWSNQENREWQDYKMRLAHQSYFLDRMNINYYRSPLIDWPKKDHIN
ncbi:MAG: family 20 glycosylhydrolase [Bacteroidota bacterium]